AATQHFFYSVIVVRGNRLKLNILLAALMVVSTASAQAGMSSIVLTDIAKARLESLSFFIAIYFLLAWGVKGLWNLLAKSFSWMPRINYRRALALMLVSGLFLYVILTMISGARELLTPGAWSKKGVGYELSSSSRTRGKGSDKEGRKRAMENLKASLWRYAQSHDGKLPHGIFDKSFGLHHWELPDEPGYYAYLAGQEIGGGNDVLVYEPSIMGEMRYVLLTDGSIEAWRAGKLREELENDE
ncbi:MAG: hypothetical protein ACPGUY_08860, partial [Akkermansiaceae bacterium]